MFLKLNQTHSHSSAFGGLSEIPEEIEIYINFDLVLRFNYRQENYCTVIRFQDGTMIGVAESPEDIMSRLK